MKNFIYSIFTIGCVLAAISGIWYLQTGDTFEDQVEYIQVNFLDGVGETASNTANSASKLGRVLKDNFDDAKEAGAFIVGTGSSEKPNQINNVLVFPGIFRGALDARAKITSEMMKAASYAIKNCIGEEELNPEYIIPYAWDKKAHEAVAKAVKEYSK